MSERTTLTASVLWLITSFLCLTLPIFVPSSSNPSGFLTDPLSISTGVMFVLSFPGGLLSLLFSPILDLALGIDPNSIQGMYLDLKLMFVLGLAQWFWVMPRLRSHRSERSEEDLRSRAMLPEERSSGDYQVFGRESQTPLERVIDDDP